MLTEAECRNATCPPDKKLARFYDGGGMYMQVSPGGSKRWFLKYRVSGKEKQLALGSYPALSLKEARLKRDTAKLQKAVGIDPIQSKKVEKLEAVNPAGDSFKVVALEWYEKQVPHWSEVHPVRSKRQFERDLFPWLDDRRLADIEPVELLATLRKVEERVRQQLDTSFPAATAAVKVLEDLGIVAEMTGQKKTGVTATRPTLNCSLGDKHPQASSYPDECS